MQQNRSFVERLLRQYFAVPDFSWLQLLCLCHFKGDYST
jgi:hypothetical protein